MRTKNKNIGIGHPCYVIAEIGHNHQGNGDIALELIRQAAAAGADAVKFQKRDNRTLFCPDFYNQPYNNSNSFGDTYGAHREFLEPRKEWLLAANELTHALGLDFIMTVFDTESLKFCEQHLNIDAYKIQSADLSFDVLIMAVAATSKPYFISCGASSLNEIKRSFSLCASLQTSCCFMYTVSAYPTAVDKLNLARINELKGILSTEMIGYSCHYPGIEPSVYARILGCAAIEKHFTLDKKQKGPDHKLSVTPSELKELIRRVNEADSMMGAKWMCDNEIEIHQVDARYKMGKSPVLLKDAFEGETINLEDITYLSPAKGMTPAEINNFFGLPLKTTLKKGSYLLRENFI